MDEEIEKTLERRLQNPFIESAALSGAAGVGSVICMVRVLLHS